ncbi:MAG: PDZ domain-containing protein [Xanthomonadales bacterium]|nr:PDZ domain-containing protein [Xanthomonadales bacterium]
MDRHPASSAFDRRTIGLTLVLGLFAAGPVGAQSADARTVEAGDSAILSLIESGAIDVWSDAPVVLQQPARVRHELGAVVNPQPGDGGPPRIMAITPGGAAERMQLSVGDRLLAVNGTALTADSATHVLREAVEAEDGRLAMQVQREGSVLALNGEVDRVELPAYRIEVDPLPADRGCGRISLTLKPPAADRLYPAVLHEIDGKLPGPLDSEVFRVRPGKRVLKISEAIDSRRFDRIENLQRDKLLRNERFKYLSIDVEPDTTYRIGVRFDPEQTRPVRDQAYWEPVVWKTQEQRCR